MENKYDIIVIGAGNGGLAAAAEAAYNKKKVLVLERNLVPGGCATSFRRGRFEFEPSLHELAAVGDKDNPGTCYKMFKKYGMNLNLITLNDAFRAITLDKDGYDVTMPIGIEAFSKKLLEECPTDKKAIDKLFALLKNCVDAGEYFNAGHMNYLTVVLKYRPFMMASAHTVKTVLDWCGFSPKAESIISAYWPYLGSSIKKLDGMFYLSMLDSYIRLKPVIPKYRSHELSEAFEKVIKDNGGEVWYNTNVSSLIYENKKVCGVKINDRSIYAEQVITSTFPEKVYSDMVPKSIIPKKAHQLVNARKYGIKFYTVYLGLDISCEELGVKDYTIILNEFTDPMLQYKYFNDYEKSPVFINFLNIANPGCSPEGTSMVYITGMHAPLKEDGMDEEHYMDWKRHIADILISRCEKALHIDMKSHIEEMEICTPSTFARYMNSPYGTPYGYEVDLWDSCTIRTQSRKDEEFIRGLSYVGAHTEMGDGYCTNYMTGSKIAKEVSKEIK